MKKIVSLVLIVVMAMSFASCGKNGSDEVVTLTWLAPGEAQPDHEIVMEKLNEILEAKIGVKLDLQLIPNSAYGQKMKMNMASGTPFDLCFTSNWLNPYSEAATDGGLYDITDLMDDEVKAFFSDDTWNASRVGGRIYAVPNNQVMFMQYAIGVQKSLLEKYNFDITKVKEVTDIEPFLEIIKKNEPELYAYNNSQGTKPFVYHILQDAVTNTGVGIRYKNGNIVKNHEQPEVIAANEKIREWYKKGYIRSDYASAGGDGSASSAEVRQGKYATFICTWKPGLEQLSNIGVDYVYAPLGVPVKGSPTAAMTAIGANCKNPEKAMELIKFINTDVEAFNLLCYGIEGTHYTKDADGFIELKADSRYVPQGDWKFGNQFNAYLTKGLPADIWEETQKLNDEALTLPTTGFVFDTEPVKKELAQLASVYQEYYNSVTVEDYDKFLKNRLSAMKTSGYDKVFKEIKSQYDEFKKEK